MIEGATLSHLRFAVLFYIPQKTVRIAINAMAPP